MFERIPTFERMLNERNAQLSEPVSLYLSIAEELERHPGHEFKGRAAFIRDQCSGFDAGRLFQKYRKAWNIPLFAEGILDVSDFKRGFLYRFREYSTSWNDSLAAKDWFLRSEEARAVRRYEFRHCDDGFEQCSILIEGSYRQILERLLQDGDYAVLASPAFTKSDLDSFIKSYIPDKGDFTMEQIIEDYIQHNPNY
ncbi:hypothetical protein [Flavisolibacter ginsenosidimutans]|uniref:Uncharacterized protein n=1 Tax=Flavisolibacter ginsenosidimutans TaxID=661481 RepID=A0A5B8UFQ5_9BACT|nr:hypothetical protein [Flavisolibacter ginsenosidimutans]QEC55313.1 hypothetical protein FSB75_05125 [Flavisolibacter ginsenosidimutans]